MNHTNRNQQESRKLFLQKYKIEDYTLEFEAEGLKLLFQELMYNHYYPKKSLMVLKNGVIKSLILNSVWKEKGEEGFEILSKGESLFFDEIAANIKEIWKKTSSINEKQKLTKTDTEFFLTLFESAAKLYAYFNMAYFEKAYLYSNKSSALLKNLERVEHLKEKVKDDFNKVFFFSRSNWNIFLKIISSQLKISEESIGWYLKGEILSLFNGEFIEQRVITQRMNSFVFYEFEDKEYFIQGEEANNFISILEDKKQKELESEFSGTVANVSVSKITGKVKVINVNYDDLGETQKKVTEMKKGDILISRTTDPSLIIACEKASAIVTDVGGLLSHAAIVSREKGIPCIVGTKVATKVLKDGDLIEVDATKGTVKVIKHSSSSK
jgi:phosphohistidine swiveling domain-containing protein